MHDLFRNPIGWDDERKATYRRRRTALGMIAAFAQYAGTIGFGAFFVAAASGLVSLASGVAAGLVAAAIALWWRRRHPHDIPEPQLVDVDVRAARRKAAGLDDADQDSEDDEGGWDVPSALLAAVVVPVFALVMLLFAGIVPLLIILGIHAASPDSDWLHVGVAFGLCLLVSACVEFGVVLPLAKRWGIDLDD